MYLLLLCYFIQLQEEGGDVQEIEIKVEEDAEAEKEDLKAREARKKVSHNFVCYICIHFTVLDSLKENLPLHHLERYSHLLLLRIMIQKVLTISIIFANWVSLSEPHTGW